MKGSGSRREGGLIRGLERGEWMIGAVGWSEQSGFEFVRGGWNGKERGEVMEFERKLVRVGVDIDDHCTR